MKTTISKNNRIISIDVFRALTMLLMIFVNFLGNINEIPSWLLHATYEEDKLGLADIVFPCFIFIVGMSIPFAVNNRIERGDTNSKIILHIIIRSISLLIMGVFLVNTEYINEKLTGISAVSFQLLVVTGILLVWNSYPKGESKFNWVFIALRILGAILLISLVYIYRGGELENVLYFQTHWWGILGLIGWTYLLCSIIYLYVKKSILVLFPIGIFFLIYNILTHATIIQLPSSIEDIIGFLGNGAFPALAIGGILASLLYIWAKENNKIREFIIILFIISILMLIGGFITRQFGGISKIRATPSWVFFSMAISYSFFCLLFWLTDIKGKQKLFKIIEPAGTFTLLCYFIPYFYDSITSMIGLNLLDFFNTGIIGLLKTCILSLLIIQFTGFISRYGIKMKL